MHIDVSMRLTLRVSVIIPCHNSAATVARAVKSVLDQSYPPFEIIVVDDQSSDSTVKVVKDLCEWDDRVRLVTHEVNLGGGAARNSGIDAATGDIVAFLDADDIWLPIKLQTQLEAWSGSENDIVYNNVRIVRRDGATKDWNRRGIMPFESVGDYCLVRRYAVQTSTILLSIGFAKAVRFDPRLRRHQDWDFVIRAEMKGARFTYVNQCLVIYDSSQDQSVSRSLNLEPTLFWLNMFEKNLTARQISAVELNVVALKMASLSRRRALVKTLKVALTHKGALLDGIRVLAKLAIGKY